jgi:hypothetical protein
MPGVTFKREEDAMAITINIFVTPQGAAVRKNRDSEDPDGQVTWIFDPHSNNYRVVFRGSRLPDGSSGPISPFSGVLLTVGGQVTAKIDHSAQAGLYFYEIEDGAGNVLPWLNPIGTGLLNFGGLDVPKGPP